MESGKDPVRLRHLIPESEEGSIDVRPGAVLMIDYSDMGGPRQADDRLTIIDTFVTETPGDSRIKSSHVMVALTHWEMLRGEGGKTNKENYDLYVFALEEGIGGRMVHKDNIAWGMSIDFSSLKQGIREFESAKAQNWVPDLTCGWRVYQIA